MCQSFQCSKCLSTLPVEDFHVDSTRSTGRAALCKLCVKKKNAASYRKHTEKRKQEAIAYYHKNKEVRRAQVKARYARRIEEERAWHRTHKKNNRFLYNAYDASRRASKLSATPKWLTKEQKKQIKDLYWLAKDVQKVSGESYHVDHIVPLQGETVCGLHVPWNLQILPADINIGKKNKQEVTL